MITTTLLGIFLGIGLAALITLLFGVYSIGPTERGVLTTFGRVQRTPGTTVDDPHLGALLNDEEKVRMEPTVDAFRQRLADRYKDPKLALFYAVPQ